MVAAGRCLLRHGHRRVALVSPMREPTRVGSQRLESFQHAFREADQDASLITRIGIDDPRDCVVEMQRLLASGNRPTAVVCSSGLLTPHTLEGIISAGLTVPDDVSFLTFGDSPRHRAHVPSISTIRKDYTTSARRGVHRIVARIEGTPLPEPVPNPAEFVSRESIGPSVRQ